MKLPSYRIQNLHFFWNWSYWVMVCKRNDWNNQWIHTADLNVSLEGLSFTDFSYHTPSILGSEKPRQENIYGFEARIEDTVKWKFLVSLETQLCHVMFFWKLSCERMFCWGRHLRGPMMFGKTLIITPQTVNGALVLVHLAMLCWSLLVVTS